MDGVLRLPCLRCLCTFRTAVWAKPTDIDTFSLSLPRASSVCPIPFLPSLLVHSPSLPCLARLSSYGMTPHSPSPPTATSSTNSRRFSSTPPFTARCPPPSPPLIMSPTSPRSSSTSSAPLTKPSRPCSSPHPPPPSPARPLPMRPFPRQLFRLHPPPHPHLHLPYVPPTLLPSHSIATIAWWCCTATARRRRSSLASLFRPEWP